MLLPIMQPILNPIMRAITEYRGGGFSPLSLSPVVWYDPSDMSTLFQDALGVTQVTAAGQTVGLMLDKSQGLVLGPEVARQTLESGWDNADPRWTYSANSVSWAGGGGANSNASKVFLDSSYRDKFVEVTWTISGWSGTGDGGLSNGNISSLPGGAIGEITTTRIGNGTYTVRGYWRGSGNADRWLGLLGRGSHSYTLTIDSVRELPGNHASQATSTKRPLLQSDGTHWWLKGDGIDDFMQTGNIDLTGTDKLSVFAGVMRNSADAFRELINFAGDPNTIAGSFDLALPLGTGVNQSSRVFMRGTSASGGNSFPASALSAPSVLSATYNLAGSTYPTLSTLRSNSIAQTGAALGLASLGGSFANAPLWLFSRGGTGIYGTANLYPLIIVPRLTTTEETEATEKWVAERTGVTL
jgi:hypothetical protein